MQVSHLTFAALLTVAMAAQWCLAADEVKTCFIGEAKLSDASGKSMGSQALLVKKSENHEKDLIVETAIVVTSKGQVERRPMHLQVSGNTFTLKDDTGTISGEGALFGIPWQWTYWRGTFHAPNGIQIEDENFIADPSMAVARKKITGADGKVLMYMDVTLKSITSETFQILSRALLKKGKD